MFERFGAFVEARKIWVLVVCTVVLLLGVAGLVDGGRLTAATIAGLESDQATRLVDSVTGRPEDTSLAVVFRVKPGQSLTINDPEFAAARDDVLGRVRALPGINAVVTYKEAPAFLADRMRNREKGAELVFLGMAGTPDDALQIFPAVRRELTSPSLDVASTGNLAFVDDLAKVLQKDLMHAELISLPLAVLVLLFVFRTAVAAVLPVLVGGLAVVCGIATVMLLSHWFSIAQYTINVCSLIGFGVAIDYSLFLVSRYREELAGGASYRDALVRAVATAGRAVAFSGLAVGAGLAGLFFFEGSYLSVMGMGGSIVVVFAVGFALTLLPAMLGVLGPAIHKGRLPGMQVQRDPSQGIWHRIAQTVMRSPVVFLLAVLGILLTLASPARFMRLAALEVQDLPADTDARRGIDALAESFPELAAERLSVAVRFPSEPVLTKERIGALYDLGERLRAVPGVVRVDSIVPNELPGEEKQALSRDDAIELLSQTDEMSQSTLEEAKKLTVKGPVTILYAILDDAATPAIRDQAVAQIRAERSVGDGTLLVGGKAAHDVDSTHFMVSRAPNAAFFVVGVTFVVVFLLLRSVLLPIKAVIMNMLSIAATFGGLVWIFQEGHLFVHQGRPLEPTLPVLLFCVSFGLSMDYEVLMLARMKEAYERTHDNTLAVAEGLENSAGLVTSAAAIMVSVFVAFALARIVVLQATGVGLALAVALDATLIRALLVPATMRLLGDWNWWAPRGLRGPGIGH